MGNNIIAIPPYYEATSFAEIVAGLKIANTKIGNKFRFIEVTPGPLKNQVGGDLLDDEQYIIGQWNLISALLQEQEVDSILFIDFFNPGMSLLRYAHEQRGVKIKYGALLHGGSFYDGDLYSFSWSASVEHAWAELFDIVYVPSDFARIAMSKELQAKTRVFPWGMDAVKFLKKDLDKKWDVVFPHRLQSDKGVEDFITIVGECDGVSFVVPVPNEDSGANKFLNSLRVFPNIDFAFGQADEQHLSTLQQSRIVLSCAKQELFGYSVQKAVLGGCLPVLPNRLCYPEQFDQEYLYVSIGEAVEKISFFLSSSMKPPVVETHTFVDLLRDFLKSS